MMLSDVSVRRPVFAAVAAIVLCVIGAAAFFFLPVRELPDVDPPIVSVNTTYAGASAEVIESRITEPVEQQIAGIQGVERINSTSLNRLELTDYADRYLIDRLATVPGAAQVQIYGEQRYAMRIWLDAAALAARGLTVTDVETALTAQNVELPAGSLESGQKDYTVRVARTYARAEDFRQLPIGTRGSASASATVATGTGSGSSAIIQGQPTYVTRLGDIARVEEAPEEDRRLFRGNGMDQIGLVRQAADHARDAVAHVVGGVVDVAVQREFDVHARPAVAAGRGDALDALDAGDLLLDGLGDPAFDDLGGGPGVAGVHRHDRRIDVRQFAHRQEEEGRGADHAQHDRRHRRHDGAADGNVGEHHRAAPWAGAARPPCPPP